MVEPVPEQILYKKYEEAKVFLCVAQTADGPTYFLVESEATYNDIIELNNGGSDEAGMWGGHEFDVTWHYLVENGYGPQVPEGVEGMPCVESVIKEIDAAAALVRAIAADAASDDVEDDGAGYGYDSEHESEYLKLVQG